MSVDDLRFAARAARYLREHHVRPDQIERVLRSDLQCPPSLAARLSAPSSAA